MSTWQNPPHPGFSVDPSMAPALRPSTSDRDYADTTLRAAHADGRLTDTELAERVERAESSTSLGELGSVIADVTLPTAAGATSALLPTATSMPPVVTQLDPGRREAQVILTRSVVSWVALAVLFNVIWVFTLGISSSFHGYYWPIWPMLGTALPLIGLVMARFGPDRRPPSRRVEPPADLR